MRCWTAIALGLMLNIVTGCVAGEDGDELDAAGLELLGEELAAERVAPDGDDEALCESLAQREASCTGGFVRTTGGCAERFACSKRLWRADAVEDVYACIEDAGCELDDPATSCLAEVAAELTPSETERRTQRLIAEVAPQCPGMLDITPGQSDEVYDLVGSCIEADDDCEAIGTCVVVSLDALADDLCAPPLETL
jgi:hypothetical protein